MVRDFREKFHISLNEVGLSVRYGEAQDLITSLARDPSSWFHADKAEWKHPISREGMVLLEIASMIYARLTKKGARPYVFPWPSATQTKLGAGQKMTKSEVYDILRPDTDDSGLLPPD